MESFRWNKNFETGLSAVDQQHHHLVDIINQYGALLIENKVVLDDIDKVFKDLSSYAQYHFKEEESLMIQIGIDQRHLDVHTGQHESFLQEVVSLYSTISQDNPGSAKYLFDFLSHWLAYHILGSDQNMARQIKAIHSGSSPGKAYQQEEKERDKATEPLLLALDGFFEQVSARNRELIQLNQSLEEKVAQRTRELSEKNLLLEVLSLTDVLTGLPNRRHAIRRLAALWEESIQDDSALVCMMIDADHFKEVNDDCGHDAGDVVLIELGKALQHSVRTDDIVCRLGGDEFFVICPNTQKDGGMHLAELIRKTVSELRVPTGDRAWLGSISVGVAARTPDMKNYEELIKVADKGVYAAKEDGRNCVRAVN